MAKTKTTKTRKVTRPRRDLEARIAELDAKLSALRQRIAAKRNPALKHVLAASKALDRAVEACEEAPMRQKLIEAREILARLEPASENGRETLSPSPRRGRGRGALGSIDEASLLEHVRAHPGQRGEQISQALGVDTATLRPVMKRLIAAGQVRTEGQRRGMNYSAV